LTARSVVVTWSAAANTGGVPLTGIDLRYWPYDAQNPDRETGARTHPADDGNDRGETLTGVGGQHGIRSENARLQRPQGPPLLQLVRRSPVYDAGRDHADARADARGAAAAQSQCRA
ncbi:MAG: hypothetical protein OXP73_10825, partial [Chloroflexota bacterium]|nr:hypothetical protein [Chloroflexota bacterium]